LLTILNIHPDDSAGTETRSLVVMEPESEVMWNFPFTGMTNTSGVANATEGQPMHTALHPNRRIVYVTMGGTAALSLRLLVVDLGWAGGEPSPTITDCFEVLPAGTGNLQEGHGTRMTPDGNFMLFSELNNDRVRVFDTRAKAFVGTPISHADIDDPHGMWPNFSDTLAVVPNYLLDTPVITVWDMDPATGAMTYNKSVDLQDGPAGGSWAHTVAWISETEFYLNMTQTATMGTPDSSEQGIWLINAETGVANQAIGAAAVGDGSSGLLTSASDHVIAGNNLYVCEGNVTAAAPGHVSVWDISDAAAPTFVTRLSPDAGLPSDFLDCHGALVSPTEDYVFFYSFVSEHIIKVNTNTNQMVRAFTAADGLAIPHGGYIQ
jgi:hypothetical protein